MNDSSARVWFVGYDDQKIGFVTTRIFCDANGLTKKQVAKFAKNHSRVNRPLKVKELQAATSLKSHHFSA